MLEPTKKRRTKKKIELHFTGPESNKTKAIKALQALGFKDVSASGSIPWREMFPELIPETETGVSLAGARHKENLTQRQLSELTGIPQRHISEMENAKRPIGKKNARIFAKVLKVSYKVFL